MTKKQMSVLAALVDGPKSIRVLYQILCPEKKAGRGASQGGPAGDAVTVHFYCGRHLRRLVERVLEPPCKRKPDGWFGDMYRITDEGRKAFLKAAV